MASDLSSSIFKRAKHASQSLTARIKVTISAVECPLYPAQVPA
jgi:hypothetical protein